MQDRERLLALPLVPENSHSTNYKNQPPAPPPPPGSGMAGILTSSTSVVSVCISENIIKIKKKILQKMVRRFFFDDANKTNKSKRKKRNK